MKNFFVVLLATMCIASISFAQTTTNESQKLTLRVTSSSEKSISFVASIFFKTDKARLDNTMQQTPYEITVESNYVNATIIKTSGDGDLIVDLIKSKKVGDQPDLKASSSTAVVVGTQNAEKGIYYQQTF
ncbi:MAG TPA: hypothetical protein VMV32_05680 [Ignavibacteriaceae bacterium]|nr:hypothetical protein [Ignavibacteriaceae bacterium]